MTQAIHKAPGAASTSLDAATVARQFKDVRAASVALAAPLAVEDQVIQSMPDASPTKWHLAHTTWFFESFVLAPHVPGYTPHHPRFAYLFNSYYNTMGEMHRRPLRGLLSRPTVEEVHAYRQAVDAQVEDLLRQQGEPSLLNLITLGLNHEQQHQELLLTDIKHALAQNPLQPVYRDSQAQSRPPTAALKFIDRPSGMLNIGHDGPAFAFDNETPRHEALIRPHALANRPVTNAEYRAFIEDNGYRRAELWLSDGWSTVQQEGWRRPLYWNDTLSGEFTLAGPQALDDDAPVCHVSFYEADAYATWAGARLPTEMELELAANESTLGDDFADNHLFHPQRPTGDAPLQQIYGGTWEWTMSPYAPYPGFTPLAGSLGEYNGKFMCNQMVLRGGSCATPATHMRPTYRNFFYPHSRWQFSGIRLAKDIT